MEASSNNFQFFEILIALIALFVSILVAKRTEKLSEGQLEFQMAIWLRDSMLTYVEASLEKEEYENTWNKKLLNKNKNINTDPKYNTLALRVKVLQESCLNAYEESCAKYINNKIDRKYFKSSYFNSIKDIFESGVFDEKLNKDEYPYLHEVYIRWNTPTPLWKIYCRKFFFFLN